MGNVTRSVFRTRKIAYYNFLEQIKHLNSILAKGAVIHSINYDTTPEATDTRSWAEIYYEEFI